MTAQDIANLLMAITIGMIMIWELYVQKDLDRISKRIDDLEERISALMKEVEE